MDGLGLILLFGLIGIVLSVCCLINPKYHKYVLGAFCAPVAFSIVFLLGSWILADMNPAKEYGASYVLSGHEHSPTKLQVGLWLASSCITPGLIFFASIWVQKSLIWMQKRFVSSTLSGKQI